MVFIAPEVVTAAATIRSPIAPPNVNASQSTTPFMVPVAVAPEASGPPSGSGPVVSGPPLTLRNETV